MTLPGDVDACLRGERLWGDDWDDGPAVEEWYRDEAEAYADLSGDGGRADYGYHGLNTVLGYSRLDGRRFEHALGFGSATAEELAPIADNLGRITVVEPSGRFDRGELRGRPVAYARPGALGTLPFPDGTFDLITCFGVLHHLPKVTRTLGELHRVLRPGGVLLVREPTVSMGDWRRPRGGLTRRERGIPLSILRNIVRTVGFDVVQETRCMFSLLARLRRYKVPIYEHPSLVRLDRALCAAFAWNTVYHPSSWLERVRPTCCFMVLTRGRELA